MLSGRPIALTIVVLILAIVVLSVLVRRVEPHFAFFPSPGETTTPAQAGIAYESLTIHTADGERVHAWLMRAPAARATVIYFHGNGGNLSVWAPIVTETRRRGLTVLAVDYRGYGLSTGRPSEPGLYRDVDAVLGRTATLGLGSAPLVYWGRSLGSTMAAYAARVRKPDGVILESGFPDARAVIRSSPPMLLLWLFSSYRFPTARHLHRVDIPILVMHGDRDSVIPYPLGQALFDGIQGPKTFFTIRGTDHNDFPADPASYWRAVDAFIATLKRPAPGAGGSEDPRARPHPAGDEGHL